MDKKLQDLVWSILPKEFKEEVKFEYHRVATKASKEEYDLGFMHAHEGVFGIHNLTSDAEGEEMLPVEKSRVQQQYKRATQLKDDSDSKWELVGDQIERVLIGLFGSKCLPDEEPKPAEPKFKRGDKAKIVGGNPEFIGKVVEIEAVDSKGTIVVYLPNAGHSTYKKDYLEPYTEPEKNIAENRNFSQDCNKQFDNILKDSFRNERRLNVATQITASIYANDKAASRFDSIEALVRKALDIADTLIAECEKKGGSK